MSFNLEVVLDGLRVICADHEERLALLSGSESVMDENFDFIVLDYLPGAAEAGLIPPDTAETIERLFKEADEFLSPLTWKQEDVLMKARPAKVKAWQEQARICIEQIEAHNKKLQPIASRRLS
ncbi:hypothetical protein ACSVIJ_25625 [Pseudomonas sp. NCHU5208]|uniref:hypothetical protein n=1 Tax=unclassified Pseudomonas TaxID=196821 RepID=UPI003F9AD034